MPFDLNHARELMKWNTGSIRVGLADVPLDELTEEAAAYLQVAQQAQDSGASWGEAYAAAEAWAESRESTKEEKSSQDESVDPAEESC